LTATNLKACELANWGSFYASATADGVVPEFPSVYVWTDAAEFSLARYNPDTLAVGPTIAAIGTFNASQSVTTCNP